ncbi:unnamed protein product [Ilex paraguariensis]|uniref:Uncharacterized protein n=1 Tax=Ilex paraguariensis TaxID=185542 RepID=A0ABC8R357_9AQUA
MADPKWRRSFIYRFIPTAILISAAFFIGSAFIVLDYKQKYSRLRVVDAVEMTKPNICENQCRPDGSEILPSGIVSRTSDLEMRPLWGPRNKKKSKSPMNLLAMAVGIKQKNNVNKTVMKFPANDFVIMLFHYDGMVDDWRDFEWSSRAIHVSAVHQTKWWFAKRFLHPDVVSEYAYIFLWDEDLGVENFNVARYLAIIKEEGLQISQPALDPRKSKVHHRLTARQKGSKVHRRIINSSVARKGCNANSTQPPCTGWVEMMAPVFSKASWRCAWYMIQNDLVHAWGLDFQLGYCAQGNRTQNIGIVDSEFLVHQGLPTLGGSAVNQKNTEAISEASQNGNLPNGGAMAPSVSHQPNTRDKVIKESYIELKRFKNRWRKAVREDKCWAERISNH